MADTSAIEARISEIKALIKIWHHFYDVLARAFGDYALTEQDNKEFQEIKQQIAQKHESFMRVVDRDQHIAQNVLDCVKRTIAIQDFPKMSEVSIDKTVIEWHDANILLFETLGELEWEKERISRITSSQESAAKANAFMNQIKSMLNSKGMKTFLAYVLIAIAIGGVCYYFRDPIGRSEIYLSYIKDWWEPYFYQPIMNLLGGG